MKNHSARIQNFCLVGCCLLATCNPAPLLAAPLTLKVNEGKAFRGGSDPIEIGIGKEMQAKLIQYLRFEIDSIDVTDFIQRRAKTFVFSPQQPLVPGMHELRVIVALPDGAIEETALWQFEVRTSSKYRIAEINKQVNLALMQRLSTNLPQPLPATAQAQGAAQFSSRHANGGWNVTSTADLMYNSQKTQNPSGDEMELSQYQIKADWKQDSVVLGHQLISPGSLVLNDFNRRGISATHRTDQDRLQFTGFSTRTEQITGFNNITGVESPDNRAVGAILTGYPFKDKPEALAVSLVYVDSKGISQGTGEVNDTTTGTGGNARAVILDHYNSHNLWRLRGEYADTAFDFDGKNTGFAPVQDSAYSLQLNYDTARDTSGKDRKGRNWNFTVGRQRTGPWFFSQGSTAVTPDRGTTLLTGAFQGKEIAMNSSISFGEDNVLGDATLPVTAIEAANVSFVYTPQPATVTADNGQDVKPSKSIFGNPSLSLTLMRNRLNQIKTPTGYTGDNVNSIHQEMMLAATASSDKWNWALSHSLIDQDDLVNSSNKANTVSTTLETSLQLNKYTTFAPLVQQSVTKFTSLGTNINSSAYGASVNLSYPKKWTHSLSYTANRDVASDGSTDATTRVAQLMVQLQPQQPVSGKYGINYFATGSHQYTETNGSATDGYQLFVGLNISWPTAN